MVAFTPIYELPYQEGSDPPCFGPGTGCDNLNSVWCDFANLVETQLDDFDSIVGRTSTAVPMAKVTIPSLASVTGSQQLAFTNVSFDTDNMVDLNSVLGITPNRNGYYRIDGRIQATTSGNDSRVQLNIVVGTEVIPENFAETTPGIAVGSTRSEGATSVYVRTSALWPFTDTTPAPRGITLMANQGNTTITVRYAELFVIWHSEV